GPQMNSLHACLIPEGPHRGEVLVWDGNVGVVRFLQPWSIVNPFWEPNNRFSNPFVAGGGSGYRFHNGLLQMPPDPVDPTRPAGELFCGGKTWLPDGRLFVAGGTSAYP